jgi:hypothetical protein
VAGIAAKTVESTVNAPLPPVPEEAMKFMSYDIGIATAVPDSDVIRIANNI